MVVNPGLDVLGLMNSVVVDSSSVKVLEDGEMVAAVQLQELRVEGVIEVDGLEAQGHSEVLVEIGVLWTEVGDSQLALLQVVVLALVFYEL